MRFACRAIVCVGMVGDPSPIGGAFRRILTKTACCLPPLSCAFLSRSTVSRRTPLNEAMALDGSTLAFPRPQSQKPLLVVVGFSHKSSEDFQAVESAGAFAISDDPRIDYYELADLQGVPSFVRGMILHGMRREVPAARAFALRAAYCGRRGMEKDGQLLVIQQHLPDPRGALRPCGLADERCPDDEKVAALKQALARLTHSAQP